MITTGDIATQLQRADIILTRGGGLFSRAIRAFTGSYWNHVAMVFVLADEPPKRHEGYQRTFILESATGGVDVHPIDKYLYNERQDLAILRFPRSAFPPGDHMDENFQRRVRGFALEQIDAEYAYGDLVQIANRILGPLAWLGRNVYRVFRVAASRRRGITSFICSGVVQYAYIRACYGADDKVAQFWNEFYKDPGKRLGLIVSKRTRQGFDPKERLPDLQDGLKLITPADFSEAVMDGVLSCIGQRVRGQWTQDLGRP